MADVKISALPASTTPLAGTEVLPIVQSATTRQVSVANLTAGRSVGGTNFIPSGSSVPTNGMYLPAANTLGFSTNSTFKATIDASGNLGLGVTPSAWGTSGAVFKAIEIGVVGSGILGLSSPAIPNAEVLINAYYNSGWKYAVSGYPSLRASLNGDTAGAFSWNIAPSGTAGNAISFTQAMTLLPTGQLLIGLTSATGYNNKLLITGATASTYVSTNWQGSNATALRLQSGGTPVTGDTTGISMSVGGNAEAYIGTVQNASSYADIVFQSYNGSYAERMRIESSGSLLVGTTSASFGGRVIVSNDGTTTQASLSCINTNGSGTMRQIDFFTGTNTSRIGSIESTTTSTSFNTSSDYRLKENIVPMTGALTKVLQLKPVTYKWKINGSDGQGFIAHELQEVVPDCVTGEKDAVDAKGNPDYQGVDTSFLVATLVSAIQEQQALIESLTTRLINLENK
jgi:hypothetical protein